MALNLQQQLKQQQRLIMTPQLQTSIQMLQMTSMELEQLVNQEMIENPFLEMADDEVAATEDSSNNNEISELISKSDEIETSEPNIENVEKRESERDFQKSETNQLSEGQDTISDVKSDEIPTQNELNFEEGLPRFDEVDVEWNEIYDDAEYYSSPHQKEDVEEHNFTDFVPIKESVFDNLKKQLRLSSLDEQDYKIGEYIIGNLDENGYLTVSLNEIALEFDIPLSKAESVLKIIQTFEPSGIAARDLKECLIIQLNDLGVKDPVFFEIVNNHLNMLQKKKFKEIAKKLNIPISKVAHAFNRISTLEPKPGRALSKEQTIYVKPDVIVKKIDNKYCYFINEGDLVNLKINSLYRNMLKGGNTFSKDEKRYAVDKFKSAVWLIKNIEKRKNTILKVTEVIMEHQKEFLEKGTEFLKPLTLREVAEIVGMHESTIARVTTSKYVETPRGIFELKYFFSSGLENESGEMESSIAVKQKIKTLIDNENPKKPLSDQTISKLLTKEGIQIARRTVAKYREQIKILPAKYRRDK